MIAGKGAPETVSNEPHIDRRVPAPRRVLVFRCGQLGDMIVSLPAMWALRRHWPDASFTLLCDVHPGLGRVSGSDIFAGTGIFDAIEHYRVAGDGLGKVAALGERLRLLRRLRAGRYDGVNDAGLFICLHVALSDEPADGEAPLKAVVAWEVLARPTGRDEG